MEAKGIYYRSYDSSGTPFDETEKIHILATQHTGLGDYLRLSTLPEMYTKAGYDVYMHRYAKFYDDEIKQLIVYENPYIKGFVEIPTTWSIFIDYPKGILNIPFRHKNHIANLEMHHGFEPTHTQPKVYYDAKQDLQYEDTVLVDLVSYSAEKKIPHDIEELKRNVQKLQETKFKGKKLVQVLVGALSGYDEHKRFDVVEDTISVSSIFHYCDLMRSCCGMIALDSGASHLASAMQRQNPNLQSVCLIHSKIYYDFVSRSLLLNENTDYILLESGYNKA